MMKVSKVACNLGPVVPVTRTWIVAALANEHDTVELPPAVRPAGESVQRVLLVERLTKPENPLRGVTIIVEMTVEPASTVLVDGDDAITKS